MAAVAEKKKSGVGLPALKEAEAHAMTPQEAFSILAEAKSRTSATYVCQRLYAGVSSYPRKDRDMAPVIEELTSQGTPARTRDLGTALKNMLKNHGAADVIRQIKTETAATDLLSMALKASRPRRR
jgi:hypothetical protein